MAAPLPHLPSDCLLHVIVHLDPVSTVRCAAVSRHWRRAVIENAAEIRRHPRRQADRRLLLGLFYREMYPGELGFSRSSSWSPSAVGRHWSDVLPVPSHLPAAEGTKTKFYAPLACSDGLLLLCRGLVPELCVCNPLTGFHTSIPRPTHLATSRYVLHSCHGGAELTSPRPNSFQVLAADVNRDGLLGLQNYCSERGAWGPMFRPNIDTLRMPYSYDREYRAAPVVCRGGVVHWLCSHVSDYSSPVKEFFFKKISHVVAVDLSTCSHARMVRLPMRCSMHNRDVSTKKMLMLATSTAGGDRLSLLQAGEPSNMEVSIWLYVGDRGGSGDKDDGEKSWVFWQSVNIRKLIEDADLAHYRLGCTDWTVLRTRLEWFSPKSQRVIIWIPYMGLFVLDLISMQIRRAAGDGHGHFWPYEIDLMTLCLSNMKPFS